MVLCHTFQTKMKSILEVKDVVCFDDGMTNKITITIAVFENPNNVWAELVKFLRRPDINNPSNKFSTRKDLFAKFISDEFIYSEYGNVEHSVTVSSGFCGITVYGCDYE